MKWTESLPECPLPFTWFFKSPLCSMDRPLFALVTWKIKPRQHDSSKVRGWWSSYGADSLIWVSLNCTNPEVPWLSWWISKWFPSPVDKNAELKSLLVIAYQHGSNISWRHFVLHWVLWTGFTEGASQIHRSISIKQIPQVWMSEKRGQCLADMKIGWLMLWLLVMAL